ncbi:hypothetical protein PLICRDRAFT_403555 [Plicaturopsis crispa FD-325 SS-3]|nr:hypothetical protein PLICRDRAFT_403555 [Plicaturopsis crispa FD-325 SS-3]
MESPEVLDARGNGSPPHDIDAEMEQEDNDIYRGDPPPLSRSSSPDSTASSSSDASSLPNGRLGAIAAVVELAITKWARAKSPSSSRSSSPDSSRSSIVTTSRSHMARRRRRRSSTGNLRTVKSEQDITDRIKARQESSRVPREFVLYLPPSLAPTMPPPTPTRNTATVEGRARMHSERVFRTSSLPAVHDYLDAALKTSTASRRNRRRRSQKEKLPEEVAPVSESPLHQDYMLPENVKAPSRAASFTELPLPRKSRKGKQKESQPSTVPSTIPMSHAASPTRVEEQPKSPKAWWLDVSSPTWEDMRALGKLLHLHPLTLEDILHQDPREKLDLFPRLGYYFIAFRAVEDSAGRKSIGRLAEDDDIPGPSVDAGVIGEANIYLVVFREGICSFHFADISEHTDRVRNRILLLEEIVNMSSDWIAHGILDSVVDSFVPYLDEIEKEVANVENIVFSGDPDGDSENTHDSATLRTTATVSSGRERQEGADDEKHSLYSEKADPAATKVSDVITHFSLPSPVSPLLFRRLKRVGYSTWTSISSAMRIHFEPRSTATPVTLRRMARARRLVTSLTRLLATKSEVVTRIQKRLLTTSEYGLGNGAAKNEDAEVAIYMGDIQDHILTLQHSLAHYERMLSQSHPAFLSHLRTIVSRTKGGTDKALMTLTIVTMAVLCCQTLIGVFSLNITVPTNGHDPGYPYDVFGVVIALALLILCAYLLNVRRWWIMARRRRNTVL